MSDQRKRKWTGIGLIALGSGLLMVSNNILLGWGHVWPLFLLGPGVMILRGFAARRSEWALFLGVSSAFLGAFFLLFSVGILDWARMDALWPVFPMIVGVALLAESAVRAHGSPLLIAGSTLILFTAAASLIESSVINSRVAAPFVRFWPLAFVLAGAVLLKSRPGRQTPSDPDMDAVRELLRVDEEGSDGVYAIPPGLEATILDRVRSAGDPGAALHQLVHGLKANFPRFSWVGIYRLSDSLLTIGDNDFVGPVPEFREIPTSDGICGACATAGESVVVPDVAADARFLACGRDVKSEIVVPIRADGVLIGVLDIDSEQLDSFSTSDRDFLESLASKAAPSLRIGLVSA